ncbi:MAG: ABC transporter permease [Dysgonamonadaceae bacterium]|jgi:ABC-2 type transport system permease protein|nr:ABC transporter permease [Dysgonamonadaceae bacterium]
MTPLQLIIEREYLARVKKKSFILLTILMPFLFVGIALVPAFLSMVKDSGEKTIAVIDKTGLYTTELQSSQNYRFISVDPDSPLVSYMMKLDTDYFGILDISGDLSQEPKAVSFLSEKQPPLDLLSMIENRLSEKVKNQKLEGLAHSGSADSAAIAQVLAVIDSKSNNISVSTLRKDKEGEMKESSTIVASIVGGVFTFLIYMFIMAYGAMVMQAVVEEKKNRIVEVMVSTVRPVNLLVGKIIGVGLVGMTQLIIWGILIGGLMSVATVFTAAPVLPASGAEAMIGGADSFDPAQTIAILSGINWLEIILLFFVYFIGGYMMYASLFAAIGAAVDNDQDTQQFMMPITFIILFAFYAGLYSIQNPDGPLAFWCSLFPLSSPIVMMVRLPFGVPLWEKLLSLALLFAAFLLMAWLAAKIYRVGILMYGKKPTLKEMIRWIKYK